MKALAPSLCFALLLCCTDEGPHTGNMSLALSGQFLPGELTFLEIRVFDSAEVACPDGEGLDDETASPVESRRDDTAPFDPVELELAPGSYVVEVRAGSSSSPDGEPLALGCGDVVLGAGDDRELTIALHRANRCGDGELDVVEQCDDGALESGDGCDDHCRTEPRWVNEATEGEQSRPQAAGAGNLIVACWQSDMAGTDGAPSRRFDQGGEPTSDELYVGGGHRHDCTSLDVADGAVLMTSLRGDGDAQVPYVAMWDGSGELLPPIEAGLLADESIVGSFLDPMRAVVVAARPSATLGGLVEQVVDGAGGNLVIDVEEFSVDGSGTTLGQESPSLAGASDGQHIVTWRADDGKIWARILDGPDGAGPLLRLYDGSGTCGPPRAARLEGLGEHRYAVVFSDGEEGHIVLRLITGNGEMTDLLEIGTTDGSRGPDLAVLDGTLLVTWTEVRAAGSDVFLRALTGIDRSGAPLWGFLATGEGLTQDPLQVSLSNAGDQDQPAIAAPRGSGRDVAVVFYRDASGLEGADIARRTLRVIGSDDF